MLHLPVTMITLSFKDANSEPLKVISVIFADPLLLLIFCVCLRVGCILLILKILIAHLRSTYRPRKHEVVGGPNSKPKAYALSSANTCSIVTCEH
jgi:hypothetical protein